MSGAPAGSAPTSVERFDELYAASPDPWGYTSSEYERGKYAATLAAIGDGPHRRALEVGCSIGVFTELLAPRCEKLVAMDFSARALELARKRVGNTGGVELVHGAFPQQIPEGDWDLLVCSEILYYLDRPTLMKGVRFLHGQLSRGACVVAVSWRGEGATEPLRGDWVHDLLRTQLGRWHTLDGRHPGYRLDRFDGHER